jgi:hypothetical protein
MGRLASHIAEMPAWATSGITFDSLDISGYNPFEPKSTAALLEAFDKNVAGVHNAIAGVNDETPMKKLVSQKGRRHADDDAQDRRGSQLRIKSRDPSPRSVVGLSAPQ